MWTNLIFVFGLFFGVFGSRIHEQLIGRSPFTRRTLDDYLKGMQELGEINRQLYDIPEDDSEKYDFQTRAEESDSDKPWITPYLFEGDIILTPTQLRETIDYAKQQLAEKMGQKTETRLKRTLTSSTRLRWTSFPIPYTISRGVNRSAILAGIQLWEDNTCVTFAENGQGRNSIQFFYSSGCFSNIGMVGGTQQISIGLGCDYPAIVAHEIGHSLGYYHEQARFDRDDYVRILTQNIQSGLESQFSKQSPQSMITFGVPYDYGSVMHYDPYSFSRNNQPTIQTLDMNFMDTIGQRVGLSFNDIKKINFAYCNATCSNQLQCQRGGYTDPKNCSRCRCPEGIGGTLCNEVLTTNDDCGQLLLTATPAKQTLSKSGAANCNWVILAPAGQHVIITIDNVRFNAYSPCETTYVEIKYGPDITNTGSRLCDGVQDNQVTSQTNEVVVLYRSTSRSNSFSITFGSDRFLDGSPENTTTTTTTTEATTTTSEPETTTTEPETTTTTTIEPETTTTTGPETTTTTGPETTTTSEPETTTTIEPETTTTTTSSPCSTTTTTAPLTTLPPCVTTTSVRPSTTTTTQKPTTTVSPCGTTTTTAAPCGTTTTTASPIACEHPPVATSRLSVFDQKLNEIRSEAIKMLIAVVEEYQQSYDVEAEQKRYKFHSQLRELDSYLRGMRSVQYDSSSQSSEEEKENNETTEEKPMITQEEISPSEESVNGSISEVDSVRRRRSPSVVQKYLKLVDELEQEIKNL